MIRILWIALRQMYAGDRKFYYRSEKASYRTELDGRKADRMYFGGLR